MSGEGAIGSYIYKGMRRLDHIKVEGHLIAFVGCCEGVEWIIEM